MKLKHSNRQYESTVSGKKIKMGFAADAAQHLAELMSNSVYQDKYGSIVREVVSNAIDANKESGSTNKVVVHIEHKPSMSDQVGFLSVQDSGPGISPERIENIFTQYFASTKRDTNEQIGGFGIGAKSPFAYTPVFTVISCHNGTKRTYLMEKSSAERTCTLVSEEPCDVSDQGTTIRIPIANRIDEVNFVNACKRQLVLLADRIEFRIPADYEFEMPTVLDLGKILLIEDANGSLWEHDGTMLSLGDVLYKVHHDEDGGYGRYRNYVLKFDIGDLSPTLSREGIELNDDAQELIQAKHDEVLELTHQWREEQSKPTADLREITQIHDRQIKYPGTNHMVAMKHKVHVPLAVKGWPGDLHVDRMNMLISRLLQPSARYHYSSGKWRSPNVISTVRDLIHRNSHQHYQIVVKNSAEKLSSVWKQWYTSIYDGINDVAIVNINTNIKDEIIEVWRRDLASIPDDKHRIEAIEKAEQVVIESLSQWVADECARYKDLQPSTEWLEARKERMKALRGVGKTGKWTAEMLKEKMPVKVHQPHGGRHREEWTIKDIKKPGVCVMQNRFVKDFPFEQEYVQPVTILVVSDGNFKRLQKAGAHCWTEADLKKIHTRRARQSVTNAKIARGQEFHRRIDRAAWRLLLTCEHPWTVTGDKQKKKLVCFHDLKYRDWCKDDKILIDGQWFSEQKLMAQAKNLRKIMNRTICGKILGTALDTHVGTDDSREFLHNLLNPQQNG